MIKAVTLWQADVSLTHPRAKLDLISEHRSSSASTYYLVRALIAAHGI